MFGSVRALVADEADLVVAEAQVALQTLIAMVMVEEALRSATGGAGKISAAAEQ